MSTVTSSSPRRILELDGLRGLAIALVLATHIPAAELKKVHGFLPDLVHLGGYLGVDAFFVLSGFLITTILLEGGGLRRFYLRRAFRIFPVYYLTLLLAHAFLRTDKALPWAFAYLSNYYFILAESPPSLLRHTWSLAVEEHFYLLWPLVLKWRGEATARLTILVLMAASLASSVLIVAMKAPQAADLIYNGTQARVWSLLLGGLWAHISRRPRGVPLPYTAGLAVAATGLAGVAVGLALAKLRSAWAPPVYSVAFSGVSLGALIIALSRGQSGSSLRQLLRAPPLRGMGAISYGLYLYHPFCYVLFMGHPPLGIEPLVNGLPFMLRLVASVALSITVAFVSYRLIEEPLLRVKDRLLPKPLRSGVTADGAG